MQNNQKDLNKNHENIKADLSSLAANIAIAIREYDFESFDFALASMEAICEYSAVLVNQVTHKVGNA